MRTLHLLAAGAALAVAAATTLATPAQAQQPTFFRIGSGAAGGTYYPIAGLLAQVMSAPAGSTPCDKGGSCGVPGLVAVAQSSNGSVANVNGIRSGQLEGGLSQSDVAYWAYTGTGLFEGKGEMKDLRVIASLFAEHAHIVALNDPAIKSLRDLKGKTIGVGLQASGALIGARIVLEAFGMKEGVDFTPDFQSTANSVSRMKDGQAAGAITITGFPSPGIVELAASKGMKLLPVDGAEQKAIVEKYPFYAASVIPANAYQGVATPTPTVTVAALLVTRENVSAETVYGITKALFHETSQKIFANGHPKAAAITLKTALDGVGIPLHPGAERFFKEAGVKK